MTTQHLVTKFQAYLDAEPRIEHGPLGIDEAAVDRSRLDAARAAASHAITVAAADGERDPEQARLVEAAERFLCAEGALRACESEHLPRLERLSRELAAARQLGKAGA